MSVTFSEPRPSTGSDSRKSSFARAKSPATLRKSSLSRHSSDYSESRSRSRDVGRSPTPHSFQKRVGFDTFDNKDATDFSLTLQAKHADYVYSRMSRTFLCGTDQNDYSDYALEWLLDDLVDDGDEVVVLRVVDPSAKISSSDSALQEKLYREEAYKLLHGVIHKNYENKKISIVLEFAVGKVQDMIQRMIEIYEPAMLIVGTRGKSLNGFQGLLPGSVSKYCLQHSPVPVIVVRPTEKRQKKKAKRQADPNRRRYLDIIESSNKAKTKKVVDVAAVLGTADDSSRASVASTDASDATSPALTLGEPEDEPLEPLSRSKSAPEAALAHMPAPGQRSASRGRDVRERDSRLSFFASFKSPGRRRQSQSGVPVVNLDGRPATPAPASPATPTTPTTPDIRIQPADDDS
ncbi:uncharacterized protein V1510DRAFT_375527 [Dipodascopsis tothii]|uniref:uncharacterized protein n=1 Tax=Dipodascopsis tothii TaxID=44089 RepID=UPI0034CF1257